MQNALDDTEDAANFKKPRVVVILNCEGLLERAVECIVHEESEWKVLRVSDSADLRTLIQKVKEANPNVVIISQNERGHEEQLLISLGQACPELQKVISVCLSDNFMEVYCKQRIWINSALDLFSVAESNIQNSDRK